MDGYAISPVTDQGDVFFVTEKRLSILDDNNVRDIYTWSSGEIQAVSLAGVVPHDEIHGGVRGVSLAADGARIAALRPQSDLDDIRDAWLWDLSGDTSSRIRIGDDAVDVSSVDLNENGLVAVYAGGTPSMIHLYRDADGSSEVITTAPDGVPANGRSWGPSVTSEGTRAVFLSDATNLDESSAETGTGVYLWSAAAGEAQRLDAAAEEPTCCDISGDGTVVGIGSQSADGGQDGILSEFVANDGEQISVVGVPGEAVQINENGRFVVYEGMRNGQRQIVLWDREEATHTVASTSASGDPANADCFSPAISPNGRYITFVSTASNLHAEAASNSPSVFLLDRGEGFRNHAPIAEEQGAVCKPGDAVVLVLEASDADGETPQLRIADLPEHGALYDGGDVASEKKITNTGTIVNDTAGRVVYVPDEGVHGWDSFTFEAVDQWGATDSASVRITVGEIADGVIQRISTPAENGAADGDSAPDFTPGRIGISGAADAVCFSSQATNLADVEDANAVEDVYLWEVEAGGGDGSCSLVSVDSSGAQGETWDASTDSTISSDGRYVVFSTLASLSVEDTNDLRDVYIRDVAAQETVLVSRVPGTGGAGDGESRSPSVSENGRYVVFASEAENLTGDSSGTPQILLWERESGTLRLLSEAAGEPANKPCRTPRLSQTGNAVVFSTGATNLGYTADAEENVFVRRLNGDPLVQVSMPEDGGTANGDSSAPSVSSAGRYVCFRSEASNLIAADQNGTSDIFLHDTHTGGILRVSEAIGGTGADAACYSPAISANGRRVYFRSTANNLISTDTNGIMSGYLWTRAGGDDGEPGLKLVSHAADPDTAGNAPTWGGALSTTGRCLAFASDATNLVPDDGNGFRDIFRADFGPQPNNAPQAGELDIQVVEGGTRTFTFPCSDEDEDDLIVTVTVPPGHGTLAATGSEAAPMRNGEDQLREGVDAVFTYTPDPDYTGSDSFEYAVTDGASTDYGIATVTIQADTSPSLQTSAQHWTVAKGELSSQVTQDFFSIQIPADPDGPDPNETWIQLMNDPSLGVLLDETGAQIHADAELLLAGLQLTYEPHDSEVFATEALTFRASGPDWETEPMEITIATGVIHQDLLLETGWNLVSFKMDPLVADSEKLLGNEVCGTVWRWNAEKAQYEKADVIEGGRGYWVFRQEDAALLEQISGKPVDQTDMPLKQGWNLLGPVGKGTFLDLPRLLYPAEAPVWGWEPSTGYQSARTLLEGLGYWISAAQEGVLSLELVAEE